MNTYVKVQCFLAYHLLTRLVFSVSEADRTALRERWATEKEGAKAMPPQPEVVYNPFGMVYSDDEDDPYYMAKEATPFGNDDGVTPTLIRDFDTVVQQVTEDLKEVFRQGLEEKLTIGSTKVSIYTFYAVMGWGLM